MRGAHVVATALVLLAAIAATGCGNSNGPTPPTPTPAPRLSVLALASSNPAPGIHTRLVVSDDFGATWEPAGDGSLSDATVAIDFTDRERGVAAGATDVQRTDDGGRTWMTVISDPRTAPEEHLSFADVAIQPSGDAVAFANLGNDNFLNATGFEAWTLPADGSLPVQGSIAGAGPAAISSMCVSPDGAGVATGSFVFSMALVSYATVFDTADGGASWAFDPAVSTQGGSVGWGGAACSGRSALWLVGTSSFGGVIAPTPTALAIAHSSDGGATWVAQRSFDQNVAGGLSAAHFVDDATGWAVGGTAFDRARGTLPIVLHTSDGGDSWHFQSIPDDVVGGLTSVRFLDGDLGIVGGENFDRANARIAPLVLVTDDGGATWRPVALPDDLGPVFRVDIAR
ncbi:MAG TPA: hypothetical protein VFD92_21060 [Candidatus Binatia bacterium]|nr:hypothetical protein [Candidatus Binatia bacterium]